MSKYYGDIALGDTVQWLFTTVGTDGAPTQLAGSPTATAYTDGGTTESATGVTLTADFDTRTGLNLVSVVATGGNGFATGENIEIVLTAGTVGGTSVVGYAVGSFSIENRSALRPTTAGNTLDVAATGEAGLDFGNTTGTIDAAQIGAAAITAAKFGAGAIDANALATDAVDEIRDGLLPTQNAAFNDITFLFVAASDNVTPVTGATGMAVERSIDGGAFAAGTGTGPAEISDGIYQYDASAADMNGGKIMFRFTATGGTPGAPADRFIPIVTGGGV